MPKNKKIKSYKKGGRTDAESQYGSGSVGSYDSSANRSGRTQSTRGENGGSGYSQKSKIGPVVKDVPFKKPLGPIGSAVVSSIFPGLGPAINYGAKQQYKSRQKFAKKEGLYRDNYKTTGKVLQPNSPTGKQLVKDAGFNKRIPQPIIDRNNGKKLLPIPPKAAEAAEAASVNESSYKKPTVTDGVFNYSVGLKKGGLLIQGKPKLAKKGWK